MLLWLTYLVLYLSLYQPDHSMSSPQAVSRGSTTEPNTPEPDPINDEDENNPAGDFARLIPRSRQARIAFHEMVIETNKFPYKYRWHRRFIHVREAMEELEPELDEQSTGDEIKSSPTEEGLALLHVYTGFWRLNMDLHPANWRLGWVIGRGRWSASDAYARLATAGGVDILLVGPKPHSVRGRHALLLHSLESNSFMVIADKKIRVGEVNLGPTEMAVLGNVRTPIAIGDLEYDLTFTNIDQSIYRTQLADLSHMLEYTGLNCGEVMDPTPAETDYMIMNKYFVKSSFAKGSTCWMCPAVDKETGTSVAVKKIIAISVSELANANREIAAMKKLLSDQCPVRTCLSLHDDAYGLQSQAKRYETC
jgi:hypothetical protein